LFYNKLDGENFEIQKIYAIQNQHLFTEFESKLKTMQVTGRSKDPSWNQAKHRNLIVDYVSNFAANFVENRERKGSDVIYAVHGTKPEVVWEICKTGFANLGIVDEGYYGKGIYFTTFCEYASSYSTQKTKVFIVSAINLGKVYPVIEHPKSPQSLLGKPLEIGYNSHFILVSENGFPYFGANMEKKTKEVFFDEIVITQESQICPMFVIFATNKTQIAALPYPQDYKNLSLEEYIVDRKLFSTNQIKKETSKKGNTSDVENDTIPASHVEKFELETQRNVKGEKSVQQISFKESSEDTEEHNPTKQRKMWGGGA